MWLSLDISFSGSTIGPPDRGDWASGHKCGTGHVQREGIKSVWYRVSRHSVVLNKMCLICLETLYPMNTTQSPAHLGLHSIIYAAIDNEIMSASSAQVCYLEVHCYLNGFCISRETHQKEKVYPPRINSSYYHHPRL